MTSTTTPLSLGVTDSKGAPLGKITVRDLAHFNHLYSGLLAVLRKPAQKRPAAYRDAAQKLGIAIPKTARPKNLNNPNLSIWLKVPGSPRPSWVTLSWGTICVKEEFIPALPYEGRWWVLHPFNSMCVSLLRWGDEGWGVRVSDWDDTCYGKYFDNEKQALEAYNLVTGAGGVTHDDLIALGFEME